MKWERSLLVALAVAFLGSGAASAQTVLLDGGVRVAGLWCFPLAAEEHAFVYLPAQASLARAETGDPQFSFVRYVLDEPAEDGDSATTIRRAAGGGILAFTVRIETPEALVAEARSELPRAVEDDDAVLRGPIVFSEGRFNLVSSILTKDGDSRRKLLASGEAPVLEGDRLAFSFDLSSEQSSLLLESLQTATSDISLVFDMTFTGLSEAYDAELTIDWSEVRRSEAIDFGGSAYIVSADVEVAFDELKRDHAIELRSSGSDASMEALMGTVYSRLLELMFRPVEPERVPADQRGGLADALGALLDTDSGPLSSRNTTGFGAYVGYQLKDMRSSGKSVLNFNHRRTTERHSFITFNVGDLYQRYAGDSRFFRDVDLDDPTYARREIRVAIDGSLVPDFGRFVNSVTVVIRKVHESGRVTLREILIDGRDLETRENTSASYSFVGDTDRSKWLEYDYRTLWSFEGGGRYETEWTRTNVPMIDLFAPYHRRTVELVATPSELQSLGVRAVAIDVTYQFFGRASTEKALVRPERDSPSELELTLPLNQFDYGYSIVWMLDDGRRVRAKGIDSTGVLFLDELPDDALRKETP